MSMTILNLRNLKQSPQGPLPVCNRCLWKSASGPEEIRRLVRQNTERLQHMVRQGKANRRASLLGVKSDAAVLNLRTWQASNVTDSHPGMKQEQHEGADPGAVVISKAVLRWVGIAGREYCRDLV